MIEIQSLWRFWGDAEGGYSGVVPHNTVCARLLTEEICAMAQRQNIDCADVNCMKWPIFGISRHAECKVLLLRSDIAKLCAEFWSNVEQTSDKVYSFAIRFRNPDNTSVYFPRMYLTDVQPLVASMFGPVDAGEALYICTFKDERWARRCDRWYRSSKNLNDISTLSWDRNTLEGSDASTGMGVSSIQLRDFALCCMGKSGLMESLGFRMLAHRDIELDFGHILDEYEVDESRIQLGSTTLDPWRRWELDPPKFIGSADHRPWQKLLDESLTRAGMAVAIVPSTDYALPNKAVFNFVGETDQELAAEFMATRKADIIAGSVKISGEIADEKHASELKENKFFLRDPDLLHYIVPLYFGQQLRSRSLTILSKRSAPADGRPPAVFSPSQGTTAHSFGTGNGTAWNMRSKFLNPPIYSQSGFGWTADLEDFRDPLPSYSPNKKPTIPKGAGNFIVESDVSAWGRGDSLFDPIHHTSNSPMSGFVRLERGSLDQASSDYAYAIRDRSERAMRAAVSDIWLRGFHFPEAPWTGGTTLELRLQTDGKGFGFPVTRIHGSLEDPIVSPQESDGSEIVEGSGMVRTYRGEDGRTRVHVEWPFGIPCLIRIVNATRIEAGVDAWRYEARLIMKAFTGNENVNGFAGYYGGVGQPMISGSDVYDTDEPTFYAYNLPELANKAAFSAPGYKKPLTTPGFSVLPIGQDRDGGLHTVVVQGMIYNQSGRTQRLPGFEEDLFNDRNFPIIYFCMTNAIDGTC